MISTRKDAIAAGVGQYFTGKPCKAGHTAMRYTQSGACSQCVSETARAGRQALGVISKRQGAVAEREERLAAIAARQQEREDAKAQLIEVNVAIDHTDRHTVFETAIELCLSTYPALQRPDVQPGTTPRRGTPVYTLKVPSQHVGLITEVARALFSKHVIDIDAERRRIQGDVERMADDLADEPPEGWK